MTKCKRLCKFLEGELGRPYVWGDKDGVRGKTRGWDCSGLTKAAYKEVGIDIPDGSYNQISAGRHIDPSQAHAGCLVFKRWPITGKIHHVACVTEGGTLIEARGKKWGVIKRKYNSAEWSDAVKIDKLYEE